MRPLQQLAYWEGLILVGGFIGVVCWKLLTGAIDLRYLLYGDARRPGDSGQATFFSPGRAQLLTLTVISAVYFLLQVIENPTTFPKIPDTFLAVLGGSQAVYLGGKAQALLLGRVRDLIRRSAP
jgi:hypothetical protein